MLLLNSIVNFLEWKSVSRPRAGECYKKPLLDFKDIVNCKLLEDISVDDIISYAKKIKDQYSPTSCAYRMTIVRGFIKYWYDREVIRLNPYIIEIPKYRQNPYKAVSELDFHMLDDYLETEPQNFAIRQKRLIIRFLWETGVRVSELCDLQYPDLAQEKALIYNKKNQQQRWVFWSATTQQLLEEFLKERKLYTGLSLFVTFEGKMSIRVIQRIVSDIGNEVGISGLVCHGFRHGRAHYILKKGGTVKDIQNVLGHTNSMSSFRYLHLSEQEAGERARKFL